MGNTDAVHFREEAENLQPYLTAIRERLHQYPELSSQEFQTCATIREELEKLGLEPDPRFAAPDTVALLRGAFPGPAAALRADIDALPITERTSAPYRSKYSGVMHACGHDAHTAMLLGAAKLLAARRAQLRGNVKLIFQSAEEQAPGGARGLVERGVLEEPHVEMIFAQHVQAHIPCGRLGLRTGSFMAASDDFRISVYGRSCHAAHPQRGVDAIWAGSQIITALQGEMNRAKAPVVPAVLSVCTIQGGTKSNIIADSLVMTGTLRTLDEGIRTVLKERIATVADRTARACGASCEVVFTPGYPCVSNNSHACSVMRAAGEKVLGAGQVFSLEYPSTGSEDFAWYQQNFPGVIGHIGCGNPEKGITSAIHTPAFDIDDRVLPLGAALLAQCAWDFLR